MREGKIRIGTFAKYQRLETKQGDTIRGDSHDGRKYIFVSKFKSDGTPPPMSIQPLVGLNPAPGVELIDCIIAHGSDNLLVLCMSDVLSTEIAESFHNAAECVEIHQPDLFFHRLTKSLQRQVDFGISFLGFHSCEYVESREFAHTDPRAAELAAYLIKPIKHSYQREVRALWQCHKTLSDVEHVDVVNMKLCGLCSLIDFRVHGGNGWSYRL